MKNITWLLLFAIFTYDIFCNDSILSKLHQNGYKIKDVRLELTSYNKKFFNFFDVKTYKYNRSTPAINATFSLKVAAKDKAEVVVQGNKFLSNEYRHFPLRFQVNMEKSLQSNALGLKAIKNCGNLTNFIFEKDIVYHICNFVVDETRFPPLIPSGRYKTELTILFLNEEAAVLSLFAEAYTPIPYPKK